MTEHIENNPNLLDWNKCKVLGHSMKGGACEFCNKSAEQVNAEYNRFSGAYSPKDQTNDTQ